ncbi:MAG: ammonium transporter [Candidatus Brocadia sp.]|nr:ammonium transporter [Candidatus Brocadia sp.]
MAIKRFLKLYVVICIGLLCIPLPGVTKISRGAEVLKNELANWSADQSMLTMYDNQADLNTWASMDNASEGNDGNHRILLTNNTVASHEKPGVEPASAKAEIPGVAVAAMEDFLELTKYGKAMHVMAMLMVGFGFLMVFVKRYGYGAVTATYIAVSVVIPYYMFLKKINIFGEPAELIMDRLILAEFCGASILIAMGAFLGRLKMSQYIIMALIFVPSYMLNEWIMLDNGMGIIPKGQLIDTGGSIVIHQFGAYFGLGVIVRMTTSEDFLKKIESDKISNQFSMLGSMVLWIFWPSFCAAPAEISKMPLAAVNTVLSLCAATVSTYIASTMIRKKIAIEDMANAALAGGVAIGSSCAHTTPKASLALGFVAGILSVIGFALIQPRIQRALRGIDTCGVHNLHGMPGILGGLATIFIAENVVPGLQIKGVFVTFIIAWITGLAAGTIVSLFGYRKQSYEDAVEFIVEEEHH